MGKLLIVGESRSAEPIKQALELVGHQIQVAGNWQESISLSSQNGFDMIVLDFDVSTMSGYKVVRSMRHQKVDTYVLALLHDAKVEDRIEVFDSGADGYMTNPLCTDELIARVRSVMRRSTNKKLLTGYRVGGLAIDTEKRRLMYNGKYLKVHTGHYKILEVFAARGGGPVSKEALSLHLYGDANEVRFNGIRAQMVSLRRVLYDRCCNNVCIDTVKGTGYFLRETHNQQN